MTTRIRIWVAAAAVASVGALPAAATAKSDPAKEHQELTQKFAKLVAKVASGKADAAKANKPFTGSSCTGYADDFASFGKSNNLAEAYFNAGELYETCGEPQKAEQAYRDALQLNPKFAPAHINIGEMLFRAGQV